MDSSLGDTRPLLHLWPWSIEIKDETVSLSKGTVEFPFYGSPLLSAANNTRFIHTRRAETMTQHGPEYMGYGSSSFKSFEFPHGVFRGGIGSPKIKIRSGSVTTDIQFVPEGAATEHNLTTAEDRAMLIHHVYEWFQVFDELCRDKSSPTKRKSSTSDVSWGEIIQCLRKLHTSDTNELPTRALILKIAEDMERRVLQIVNGARRILVRERAMVSLQRFQESDRNCMRWYLRQPGDNYSEKAGSRQELLGVVRRQFFDTLENRVLKDFLERCSGLSRSYVKLIKKGIISKTTNQVSANIRLANLFRGICDEALKSSIFESVSSITGPVQPNYVLQSDYRYRKVWDWYQKLLRNDQEEDKLWEWQSRTWADVVRLLFCSAINFLSPDYEKTYSQLPGIDIQPLADARLEILVEQRTGTRLIGETLPGPFVIKWEVEGVCKRFAMEIVHPEVAEKHPLISKMGRMGGHLYLVLSPVDDASRRPIIITVWAVNTTGSLLNNSDQDIALSAYKALKTHYDILNYRAQNEIAVHGIVIANSKKEHEITQSKPLVGNAPGPYVAVLRAPIEVSGWYKFLDTLSETLEFLLGLAVED